MSIERNKPQLSKDAEMKKRRIDNDIEKNKRLKERDDRRKAQQAKQNGRLVQAKRRSRNSQNSGIRKYTFNAANRQLTKMMNSSALTIYTGRLVHWITKGWSKTEVPLRSIASNTFVYSKNKIYTQNSVKLPIVLTDFGQELPIGWLDNIRMTLRQVKDNYNRANHTNLNLTLNRVTHNVPSDLTFSDDKRLQNDFKKLVRNDDFDMRDEQLVTYSWLQSIEADDEDSLWRTYEFLELVVSGGPSSQTSELLRKGYDTLKARLSTLKLKQQDLYLTVQKYNDSFSPIGHEKKRGYDGYLRKKYIPILRSGEYLSASANLRQGSISDTTGVPVGVDVNAEKPVYIDYTDNNLPASTIVSAVTGAGKTFLIQSIIAGFLNDEKTYFPFVVDYKSEYTEFGHAAGMQVISSSPVDGVYVDTMEIPYTGNTEIDIRSKDSSLRTTENIFEILLGPDNWTVEMQAAFKFVRQNLYRSRGVNLSDPLTWKNSKNLTFHSFYSEISRTISGNTQQAVEAGGSKEIFTKMRDILSNYFDRDGDKADYFKQPLKIEDIDNRRGVIFGLDRNRNVATSAQGDQKLMLAMQYIMFILNHITDKQDDLRLVPVFYEEVNQLILLPGIAEMIANLTSGGRSRGIRNFFITNAPAQLLGAQEETKFSRTDPAVISAIISNARSVIVGANSQRDMNMIKEQFEMQSETLDIYMSLLAAQATGDNSDNSAFSHKFILRHRNKTTLIEALSNPALTEEGLFGTEVNIGKKKTEHEDKEQLRKELLHQRNDDNVQTNSARDNISKFIDDANKQNKSINEGKKF